MRSAFKRRTQLLTHVSGVPHPEHINAILLNSVNTVKSANVAVLSKCFLCTPRASLDRCCSVLVGPPLDFWKG